MKFKYILLYELYFIIFPFIYIEYSNDIQMVRPNTRRKVSVL